MIPTQDLLVELMKTNGIRGCALGDASLGLPLAKEGDFDLDTAVAWGTDILLTKLETIDALGLDDSIEDIVITLGSQIHILRPVRELSYLFVYLVAEKDSASAALARLKAREAEERLSQQMQEQMQGGTGALEMATAA